MVAVVLVWYTMLYFLFRLSHYYACLLPDVGFRFFLPKTPDFYLFHLCNKAIHEIGFEVYNCRFTFVSKVATTPK